MLRQSSTPQSPPLKPVSPPFVPHQATVSTRPSMSETTFNETDLCDKVRKPT